MIKQQLTIKVSTLKQAINEFKSVWKRHAKGEKLKTPVETLRFENTFMLMKVLTPRRLELLQELHVLKKMSIRALSKKLEREYSNVHKDVITLYKAGLILRDAAGKYCVPWNKIVTEIPMEPATTYSVPIKRYHQRDYSTHPVLSSS